MNVFVDTNGIEVYNYRVYQGSDVMCSRGSSTPFTVFFRRYTCLAFENLGEVALVVETAHPAYVRY